MDANEPATKHDIAELKAEFKTDLQQVRSEMAHGYNDLKETMRDIQTEMLKAFYNFAESNTIL